MSIKHEEEITSLKGELIIISDIRVRILKLLEQKLSKNEYNDLANEVTQTFLPFQQGVNRRIVYLRQLRD